MPRRSRDNAGHETPASDIDPRELPDAGGQRIRANSADTARSPNAAEQAGCKKGNGKTKGGGGQKARGNAQTGCDAHTWPHPDADLRRSQWAARVLRLSARPLQDGIRS